jgi:hypothetical protein
MIYNVGDEFLGGIVELQTGTVVYSESNVKLSIPLVACLNLWEDKIALTFPIG